MASILLVDDDPAVLRALEHMLRAAGHDVTTASDGMAALDILDNDKTFDLLVTDVVMPGLNGFNLARMARARRLSIKVIYVTGHSERSIAERDFGERLGPLLAKPVTYNELRREVSAQLDFGGA